MNINPYVIPGLKFRKVTIDRSTWDNDNIRKVVELISSETGFTMKQILSKNRADGLPEIRFICMWFLRTRLKLSLRVISNFFNKHHSTVIYAVSVIDDRLYIKDEKITSIIEHVKHYL